MAESDIDAIAIIEQFYPEDSPLRELLLKHSMQVQKKALEIAAEAPGVAVDREVVAAGAMLHDIGIKFCHAPSIHCHGELDYILHGSCGGDMLRNYGMEKGLNLEAYARICERHTGSGITAEEVIKQKLPLVIRDYLPETNEEKLIALADKFFSKSGDLQEKPLAKIRRSMAKFGEASLQRFDNMCDFFGIKE
jgi:uncharacterized protein